MSRVFTLKEIIEGMQNGKQVDLYNEIRIYDKNDNVDINCGIDMTLISAEQMEQLKQGKVGFFDDGEYTHIICLGKVQMATEMIKLRDLLNEKHIDWVDRSTRGKFGMERTHFEYQGKHYSVIHGFGSYGGYFDYKNQTDDKGLLELMIDKETPIGYLTADEVMKYVLDEEVEDEDID